CFLTSFLIIFFPFIFTFGRCTSPNMPDRFMISQHFFYFFGKLRINLWSTFCQIFMNRALRNTKFFSYQADCLSSFHYIIPYPDSPLFDVIMHPVRLPMLFFLRCHMTQSAVCTW